ncbi:MAG: glycoside hydrolase [Actinomycetota bacterium]|nr:glycoside hydrolase [Actinomycetota bacterium]
MALRRLLIEQARALLAANDMGPFVRPGKELYPYQWNWDSAFVAIGLAHVDPERGRAEVRSLLEGQWSDGMVPHIVFHIPAPEYSPGPELWDSRACELAPGVPTSGLTQPPVLATAVRVLHEAEPDRSFLEEVAPALERWHAWFHRERALDSGLIAIVHPWEGADNSPRFDRALARLDVEGEVDIRRTDKHEIDSSERPTDSDYVRYLYLVRRLQTEGYRPALEGWPFVFVDLTLNSILAAAEDDLAWLWGELGGDGERASAGAARLRAALTERWDEASAVYVEDDGDPAGADETIDAMFPLYAGVPQPDQARRLFDEALWAPTRFGPSREAPWPVTSASKSSPAFDPRRYWRGPVWVNVNWFFIRGLEGYGLLAEADELRRMTLELVSRSGFVEYYDPRTGDPLGVSDFSWSAALTIDLLLRGP